MHHIAGEHKIRPYDCDAHIAMYARPLRPPTAPSMHHIVGDRAGRVHAAMIHIDYIDDHDHHRTRPRQIE